MTNPNKARLLAVIGELRSEDSNKTPQDAERLLMQALQPLLEEDGYQVRPAGETTDSGLDFLAVRPQSADFQGHTLGIEFKYRRNGRPVGLQEVRTLIGAGELHEIDRVVLLANTHFTEPAREAVRRILPLQVELVDPDSLEGWVARLDLDHDGIGSEVQIIISEVSSTFVKLIARNPAVLAGLEWFDMERTMAEVFDGLGFGVALTPPAKDGGKDLILKCHVRGRKSEYYVEIKHWRSKSKVGSRAIQDFLNVIVSEHQDGGLFLSTYGYCNNAFEQLTEIDRQKLRFGKEEKIVSLCRSYTKAKSGMWSPPTNLADVVFEETLGGT